MFTNDSNSDSNGTFHGKTQNNVSKSLKSTAYVVVLLLSLIGNSLVLIVMKKNINAARKIVTNLFISHLAVADLFATICGVPIMIWRIWYDDQWIDGGTFGKILCKVDVFILETALAVSALTITLIALERYLVIYYPTKKIFTCEKVSGLGVIVWIGAAVFYSPKLYTLDIIVLKNTPICYADDRLIYPWNVIEISLYLTLFVLTLGFYIAIITKIRVYSNKAQTSSPRSKNRIEIIRKMNRRVLCQSAVIVFVHYICWMPYLFFYLSCYFTKSALSYCYSTLLIRFLAFFFGYCTTAANPFIYATLSESFRQGFRIVVYKILCCEQHGKNTTNIPLQVNPIEGLLPVRNGFFITNSAENNSPAWNAKRGLAEMKQLQLKSL